MSKVVPATEVCLNFAKAEFSQCSNLKFNKINRFSGNK